MFSIFKNASTKQEVALQDLTEEQLTQVAGGRDNDHDWDDRKKWHHRHHHHHHHHHHINDHDRDDRKMSTTQPHMTTYGGHW